MPGEIDFIARLADAWDGKGRYSLRAPAEHQALLRLANLPESMHDFRWRQLGPLERERLVFAARMGFDLGKTCAWCFGAAA